MTGKEEDYLKETEIDCLEQIENKWVRICNLNTITN